MTVEGSHGSDRSRWVVGMAGQWVGKVGNGFWLGGMCCRDGTTRTKKRSGK